jgi:ribose transport system substrate-binding protein
VSQERRRGTMSHQCRLVGAVALSVLALAASACGSSGSSASSSSGGGNGNSASSSSGGGTASSGGSGASSPAAAALKYANAVDAKQYSEAYMDVPSSGPKAQRGKNVWYISCGQAVSGCAAGAAGFLAAGKSLGWKVTLVDGKFDPNVMAGGIRQAVAAGADGIAINSIDCSALQSALASAKAAHIPTVSMFAPNCTPPLITAIAPFSGRGTPQGYKPNDPAYWAGFKSYTDDKVQWAIARTGGKMNLIDLYQTDLTATKEQDQGVRTAIARCKSCKLVDVLSFTSKDLPHIQQLITAALLKHPEANAMEFPYSGLLPAGAQAAIQQAGRSKTMNIIGGACDGPAEITLMKQGWPVACSAYSQQWTTYNEADYLNRIFAGESPATFPAKGPGYQLVDAKHNLPSGTSWTPPVDFAAKFAKLWNG